LPRGLGESKTKLFVGRGGGGSDISFLWFRQKSKPEGDFVIDLFILSFYLSQFLSQEIRFGHQNRTPPHTMVPGLAGVRPSLLMFPIFRVCLISYPT